VTNTILWPLMRQVTNLLLVYHCRCYFYYVLYLRFSWNQPSFSELFQARPGLPKAKLCDSCSHCSVVLEIHYYHHFTAIIQKSLHQPAPTVKSWMVLLEKSFTPRLPLMTAARAFALGIDARVLLMGVTCTVCVPSRLCIVLEIHSCWQGRLHHISDGANAPWKKQGEVFAGTSGGGVHKFPLQN